VPGHFSFEDALQEVPQSQDKPEPGSRQEREQFLNRPFVRDTLKALFQFPDSITSEKGVTRPFLNVLPTSRSLTTILGSNILGRFFRTGEGANKREFESEPDATMKIVMGSPSAIEERRSISAVRGSLVDADETLTHELVHFAVATDNPLFAAFSDSLTEVNQFQLGPFGNNLIRRFNDRDTTITPPEILRLQLTIGQSGEEGGPNAITAALRLIRENAFEPDRFKEGLTATEEVLPGVRAAAQRILGTDIFRSHPLRTPTAVEITGVSPVFAGPSQDTRPRRGPSSSLLPVPVLGSPK